MNRASTHTCTQGVWMCIAIAVIIQVSSSSPSKRYPPLLAHHLTKRSFFDIQCKGVYDKSIFARLDRICEDCYNLFREPQLHSLCRWGFWCVSSLGTSWALFGRVFDFYIVVACGLSDRAGKVGWKCLVSGSGMPSVDEERLDSNVEKIYCEEILYMCAFFVFLLFWNNNSSESQFLPLWF